MNWTTGITNSTTVSMNWKAFWTACMICSLFACHQSTKLPHTDMMYSDTVSMMGITVSCNVEKAVMKASLTCAIEAIHGSIDRKSTRLNSSHVRISYAVFCLKKKKKKKKK